MTIPEAAQLVLQAGLMGRSGQILCWIGEPAHRRACTDDDSPVYIPKQDVPITRLHGLATGEKLFEELLANDETTLAHPAPLLRVVGAAPTQTLTQALAQWD